MARRQDRYDFVIIGGGSAGCARANRLSADPSNSVRVLDASPGLAGHQDLFWVLASFSLLGLVTAFVLARSLAQRRAIALTGNLG